MYVCICNAFTDGAMEEAMTEQEKEGSPLTVSKVYKACSGGKSPQCGKCIPTVKDVIQSRGGPK